VVFSCTRDCPPVEDCPNRGLPGHVKGPFMSLYVYALARASGGCDMFAPGGAMILVSGCTLKRGRRSWELPAVSPGTNRGWIHSERAVA